MATAGTRRRRGPARLRRLERVRRPVDVHLLRLHRRRERRPANAPAASTRPTSSPPRPRLDRRSGARAAPFFMSVACARSALGRPARPGRPARAGDARRPPQVRQRVRLDAAARGRRRSTRSTSPTSRSRSRRARASRPARATIQEVYQQRLESLLVGRRRGRLDRRRAARGRRARQHADPVHERQRLLRTASTASATGRCSSTSRRSASRC